MGFRSTCCKAVSAFFVNDMLIGLCVLEGTCIFVALIGTKVNNKIKMTITPTITIGMIVSANEPWAGEVVSIKGKTATVDFGNGDIRQKRLTSLKPYVRKEAYWSEQELTEPVYKHGDTVYAILSRDGNGGHEVWDDVTKQCVSPSELSQI